MTKSEIVESKVKGVVASISRCLGTTDEERKKSLVTLVINTKGFSGQLSADIPYHTESEFDLIPLASALVGEEVVYIKNMNDPNYPNGRYYLEIVSGRLNGWVFRKP